MLFNELRKHQKLAAKRHPMYEKNKFGKYVVYVMAVFWIGYLVIFGTMFAFTLDDVAPNMEPYHTFNKGMYIVLMIDFIGRFSFQKTPTQEMKPYILLPIPRKRLIDFLLLRSGMSSYNLLWMFMYVPFAIFSTVSTFFGITGVITYCLGIYLVMLFNNYWYLLCRTLINERIWWVLLPVVVSSGLGVLFFFFDAPLKIFTMDLGEAFIEGNVWVFLGVIAAIAVMWLINRMAISGFMYSELNKVEDTKVKNISEYKFLERYGEMGEYFRLELKMLFRNKRTKGAVKMMIVIVLAFSCALSFLDVYDGTFMSNFIAIYNYVLFGMLILSQIMSFEGSYMDGLMSRKESLYTLLKAKYYLYSLLEIVPFVLTLPAVIMGKISLLAAFSYAFFAIGVVYFILFQMAVYNNKTVPLNEGLTGRQASGSGLQSVVSLVAFGLPMTIYFSLKGFLGDTYSLIILLVIGVGFVLTSHLWIKNIYQRFMARRYQNMQGFRDTK